MLYDGHLRKREAKGMLCVRERGDRKTDRQALFPPTSDMTLHWGEEHNLAGPVWLPEVKDCGLLRRARASLARSGHL